jgi:hypothetical protein
MSPPVIRDASSGRRTLRAKQELALEALKAWRVEESVSNTLLLRSAVDELRKAERGDHAASRKR